MRASIEAMDAAFDATVHAFERRCSERLEALLVEPSSNHPPTPNDPQSAQPSGIEAAGASDSLGVRVDPRQEALVGKQGRVQRP